MRIEFVLFWYRVFSRVYLCVKRRVVKHDDYQFNSENG